MTLRGTAAYDGRTDLPPLVAAAVRVARDSGFALSCLPAQGELLRLLAAGVGPGVIGETGTGVGVGLAWLASGAHPDARLVSVERDPTAAAAARAVFDGARDADGAPNVEVVTGDWTDLARHGPFDLLVLDGGGQGKGDYDRSGSALDGSGSARLAPRRDPEPSLTPRRDPEPSLTPRRDPDRSPPLEPARWLRPGGVLVIDDFTPMDGWPPRYGDEPDAARLHWLRHPQLLASEIRVTPEMATIIATYPGPM